MIRYPAGFVNRRKGLPTRLRRIGVQGLVSACNITILEGQPMAKVGFFESKLAMRCFYNDVLPRYRGASDIPIDRLGRRCCGFVNKLAVERYDLKNDCIGKAEVDGRYFCFVGLVIGHLTAEILAHEAVHVGFAWDYRTLGKGAFEDPHNPEENVCYPAGRFLDSCLSFIKHEKLREV